MKFGIGSREIRSVMKLEVSLGLPNYIFCHIKRRNKSKTSIFVFMCSLFPQTVFTDFIPKKKEN